MTELEKLQQENAELKQRLEKYEKPKSIFARRLKQARTKKGCTQQQLADILKKKTMSVSQYETSRNEPVLSTLVKIADYLDVSLDWLCGRTDKI